MMFITNLLLAGTTVKLDNIFQRIFQIWFGNVILIWDINIFLRICADSAIRFIHKGPVQWTLIITSTDITR